MQKPQPSRFPIHGEWAECISDQYRRAIESLLSGHRQAEVARHSGVCERTIRSWLRDPVFVQALDLARADYWTEVENRLQNAGHQAIDTLLRNLQSERPHAQIAAARLLLQVGGRGSRGVPAPIHGDRGRVPPLRSPPRQSRR